MLFFILLALVSAVSANCPAVKTVDKFQFAAFAKGVWYEVARYPVRAEAGSGCGHSEFIKEGDKVKVINYFVRGNEAKSIDGVVSVAPGAGQSGQLVFSLPYGPNNGLTENIANVLDIDYDKYVILYYCKFDEASQQIKELAWILSRSKILPDDAKVTVEKFLKESAVLDSKRYEWPSFSDEECKVISHTEM